MNKQVFFSSNGALIRGIIAVIAGGLAVFLPDLTLNSVVVYIGILILLGGVVSFIFAIRSKEKSNRNFLIMQALFNVVIGVLFLAAPATIVNIFGIIVGIGFLVIGGFQLIVAFNIIRNYRWSWFYFIISVLVIIAGVIMLSNPFKAAETILIFTGVLLLVYGIGEIFMALKLGKKPKSMQEQEDQG